MDGLLGMLDDIERAPFRLEQVAVQREVTVDEVFTERLEKLLGRRPSQFDGDAHEPEHEIVRIRSQRREDLLTELCLLREHLPGLLAVALGDELLKLEVNDAVHERLLTAARR